MTNKDIAGKIKLLADLLELHGENAFKVKNYANAYLNIRKFPGNLTESSEIDIITFPGIGKSVATKIIELVQTGKMDELDFWLKKTPAGVVEMLKIKGLGPKKVKSLWEGLHLEEVAELYQACIENRLIALKGFGEKTQIDIQEKIQFYFNNKGKFHYASVEEIAHELIKKLRGAYPTLCIELCGEIRRMMPIISSIEILVNGPVEFEKLEFLHKAEESERWFFHDIAIDFIVTNEVSFQKEWYLRSASAEFLEEMGPLNSDFTTEPEFFKNQHFTYLPPEYRETRAAAIKSKAGKPIDLIAPSDLKGVIHNHSTYSDGVNSLAEMAVEAQRLGYSYLVISDHSQSAFYANGLTTDKVFEQWSEIDQINGKNSEFTIVKGIESDILNDGRLDYPDEILKGFEIVIASIHSNLRMDKEKATERLIKAIENSFTHILGHPTGRLLLGRKGYELDHYKVIDACAANNVAIELNSNPLRMDLDWTFIPYALDKGVKIAISPDAHSVSQYQFVKFGINTARKGGLNVSNCLNSMTVQELQTWANIKK
ncbi:MAG: DNA polymerase/3'-5' exonuclease PolX [Saprospiraceae bacterium]|nr:DNA polymerase/3'-5' exonuclease PolX [Saprospiraceae bacterium]MBP9194745.1 DNA polymerase/3'-5' exonuclease PolX [Saprospiraceae bacterium]